MDGRGGCCLVRYTGDADVASKVERIMLRFRPIAPKPASPGGSPPSASPKGERGDEAAGTKVGSAAARRRGRRERGGRRGRKRRVPYPEEMAVRKRMAPTAEDLVTLQLMPETPVAAAAAGSAVASPLRDVSLSYLPVWGSTQKAEARGAVPAPAPLRPVGSWLTLESVTESCPAGERRCTWVEARAALEKDACPAFLSDAFDRVAWTNTAYWRMVGTPEGGVAPVALATGGRVPSGAGCGGFSGTLRVQYPRRRGEAGSPPTSLVVPCDVWRLAEDGWLAWRLDVKAALSLGR